MTIRQLSVVLPNRPGRLSLVSELLGKGGVNIRAISVADTTDFSAVRIVVDDPNKGTNILKSEGYEVGENEVIAVEVPDHPGGLNIILKHLREADINVQYLYPYIGRLGKDPILIFETDDVPKTKEILEQNWVKILGNEIYNL